MASSFLGTILEISEPFSAVQSGSEELQNHSERLRMAPEEVPEDSKSSPQPIRVSTQPIGGWLKLVDASPAPVGDSCKPFARRRRPLTPLRNRSASCRKPSVSAETCQRLAE